jgi:integrase
MDRAPVPKIKKSIVEASKPPADGTQIFLWDDELRGFGVRVSGTIANPVRAYIVQARVGKAGKQLRTTIGRHGIYTPETARAEAKKILGQFAQGIDPKPGKDKETAETITLAELLDKYKKAKTLRPSTISLYDGALRRCFNDWAQLPIVEISKDMVAERHKEISNRNGPRGKGEAHANQAMRILRSLFNYAGVLYEDSNGNPVVSNPVRRLSQAKLWNKNRRRQRFIPEAKLKDWYRAVIALPEDTSRDLLLVCLFTGLRRNEAASLKWKNINLVLNVLRLDEEQTKNHETHQLPLPPYLVALFKRRKAAYSEMSEFVFPGIGKSGHIVEVKRVIKQVEKDSGVEFSTHDLRRTFITHAEKLDIGYYALKRLVNHKLTEDVTSGYIGNDVERLRVPMNKIADYLIRQCKIKTNDFGNS